MRIFRHHDELDARVDEARARAQAAEEEVEVSRERHERIHQHVVVPLRRAAEHNQFAELLRASILTGHNENGSP